MKILLPIFVLLSQPARAQSESRIQFNAAALRMHLSNASDNASGRVDSRPQIMPNAGFTFSRVNGAKSGFQGFQTGVGYLAYKQTTYAEDLNGTNPRRPKISTSSHLQYLSLPAEARFGLATKRGLTPFVTVGAYVSKLLYSREEMEVNLYEAPNDDYATRYFTIANKEVSTTGIYQNIPIDGGTGKLTEGIYRSWNWGLMASLGADFLLGKRRFFSVRMPFRFSLSDAERKERLHFEGPQHSNGQPYSYSGNLYLPSDEYWNTNTPKGLAAYQNSASTNNRSTTHLFSYGIEIAYGVRLLRTSENGEPAR